MASGVIVGIFSRSIDTLVLKHFRDIAFWTNVFRHVGSKISTKALKDCEDDSLDAQ
jgi:hypothetical protein